MRIPPVLDRLSSRVRVALQGRPVNWTQQLDCGRSAEVKHVLALRDIGLDDAPRVGRKAAVLGELTRAGFRVPVGHAVVAGALEEAFGGREDLAALRA